MEKYVISIDWLEIRGYLPNVSGFLKGVENVSSSYFEAKRRDDLRTNVMQYCYEVRYQNVKVATLMCKPYSPVIRQNLCLIKLNNKVLYTRKYVPLLKDLIRAYGIMYKGITRCDVCYDCNRFSHGRLPEHFIKDFVRIDDGEVGHIHRMSSAGFSLICKQQLGCKNRYEYLRFNSGVNTRVKMYMYDKTMELKDVKDKPWIREVWKNAGLITNAAAAPDKHVWRTEISISSEGTRCLDKKTGEMYNFTIDNLDKYTDIQRLFSIYAGKYLDFRRCPEEGVKVKDYEKIQLFECEAVDDVRPIYISQKLDVGRTEKICMNVLQRISLDYSGQCFEYRDAFNKVLECLATLRGDKATAHLFYVRNRHISAKMTRIEANENDLFDVYEAPPRANIDNTVMDAMECLEPDYVPDDFYKESPEIQALALECINQIYGGLNHSNSI